MDDLIAINDGLMSLNILVAIHIILMVVLVVRFWDGRSGMLIAKMALVMFAITGLWTLFARHLLTLDGDLVEVIVSFVSLSLRVASAIIVTAWAWDELTLRKTT